MMETLILSAKNFAWTADSLGDLHIDCEFDSLHDILKRRSANTSVGVQFFAAPGKILQTFGNRSKFMLIHAHDIFLKSFRPPFSFRIRVLFEKSP